jgi:hypothetical protein
MAFIDKHVAPVREERFLFGSTLKVSPTTMKTANAPTASVSIVGIPA